MSDTPEIKVIEMVEHEDGSATLQLDMSTTAQAMLMEAGLICLLKKYVDETEVLDD
jgi:hypothetical protein